MTDIDYDEIFTQIAGRAGSLDALFDRFFGFLKRRTDLYVTFDEKQQGATMGFPEGIAEQMVLTAMKKYPFQKYDDATAASAAAAATATAASNMSASGRKSTKAKGTKGAGETPPSPPPKDGGKQQHQHQTKTDHNTTVAAAAPAVEPSITSSPTTSTSTTTTSSSGSFIQYTDKGLQVPIGNGGITESYYWTQTLTEVSVYVDVSHGTRGKDVHCTITPSSLYVAVEGVTLVSGKLDDGVKAEESMWTLSTDAGSTCILITLDKRRKNWWKSIIDGHAAIDTQMVDSTQRVADYDEGTQASIRKIWFDEQQRRQGKPTSDEIRSDELLAKAWKAPGSPFLDK